MHVFFFNIWDYLDKSTIPVSERRNIMANYNPIMGGHNLPEYISVISGSQCARIRIDDIEVIEQEGRKLHVITHDREYCFYESMKEIIMTLAGRAFYRPIRGLIINFDHVREISGNTISFHSGQVVTMGKNSITRTRSAYRKYLLRYPPYSLWEGDPYSHMYAAESGPEETLKTGSDEQKNLPKYVQINNKKFSKSC